jgi:hypothetical protein
MLPFARCHGQWLMGAGFVCGLALAAWYGSRWLAAEPGSSEDVFARIRIGMRQDEAVAVLRSHDRVDGRYVEGTTTAGRSWAGTSVFGPSFEDLPPAGEITRCVLTVMDNEGRDIGVTLGPGGTVSGRRLSPGVWEYRWRRICRAAADAKTDLLSASWWQAQPHKLHRSLRARWRSIVLAVGLGVSMTSAWVWRRWKQRRSTVQGKADESTRADRYASIGRPSD